MQKTYTECKYHRRDPLALFQTDKCKNKQNKTEKQRPIYWKVLFFKMVFKNSLENYSGKSQFAVFKRSVVAFRALPDIECYDFEELSYKKE